MIIKNYKSLLKYLILFLIFLIILSCFFNQESFADKPRSKKGKKGSKKGKKGSKKGKKGSKTRTRGGDDPAPAPAPAPAPPTEAEKAAAAKRMIKYIKLEKTRGSGWADADLSFQLSEINIIINIKSTPPTRKKLNKDDIETAIFTPSPVSKDYPELFPALNAFDGNTNTFVHTAHNWWNAVKTIEYKLLNTYDFNDIATLEVINRKDCCQNRLNNVVLFLLNEKKDVIAQYTLTGEDSSVLIKEKTL